MKYVFSDSGLLRTVKLFIITCLFVGVFAHTSMAATVQIDFRAQIYLIEYWGTPVDEDLFNGLQENAYINGFIRYDTSDVARYDGFGSGNNYYFDNDNSFVFIQEMNRSFKIFDAYVENTSNYDDLYFTNNNYPESPTSATGIVINFYGKDMFDLVPNNHLPEQPNFDQLYVSILDITTDYGWLYSGPEIISSRTLVPIPSGLYLFAASLLLLFKRKLSDYWQTGERN